MTCSPRERARLITVGPHGRATRFIEVFGELGLRRAGTTAIDVERLLEVTTGHEPPAAATRHAVGQAVSAVLTAVVALTDPQLVIIRRPWGSTWRSSTPSRRPSPAFPATFTSAGHN